MLAYFFWHWPTAAGDYERDLIAFHAALAADPPPGFLGSVVSHLPSASWLPNGGGYEDRYLLTDFAALGALNQAAVAGSLRAPHDAVAARAAGGAGGVYRLRAGSAEGLQPFRTWLAKPADTSYTRFDDLLRPFVTGGAAVWQRQLVLGPTPEFCIDTRAPIDWPAALTIYTRAIWPISG